MFLLDKALGEVDTIEGKLSSYEEMLQSVKQQMDQISQSNHLIQISNSNNGKLLDEIQFLVVRLRRVSGGCLGHVSQSLPYDMHGMGQSVITDKKLSACFKKM